jgi:hypothetical protein
MVPWACLPTAFTARIACSILRMSFMASKTRNTSDAVERRALDELVHHVVRIVAVAEQVLAAQQHLLRRVGHGRLSSRMRSQGSSPR